MIIGHFNQLRQRFGHFFVQLRGKDIPVYCNGIDGLIRFKIGFSP